MACPFTAKEVVEFFMQMAGSGIGQTPTLSKTFANKGDLAAALNKHQFASGQTLSVKDSIEIADEYFDAYQKIMLDLTSGNSAIRKAQRKVIKSLNAVEAGNDFRQMISTEIHYAMLFSGSERNRRMEAVIDSIDRVGSSYNLKKLNESVYMSKLLFFKFLADVTLTTAWMSMLRRVSFLAQYRKGSDDKAPGIVRFFRNIISGTPKIGDIEFAAAVAKDILNGGIPMTTTMEAELGVAGKKGTNETVRASEFSVKPMMTPQWLQRALQWAHVPVDPYKILAPLNYAFYSASSFVARLSSRVNNAPDSWGQTLTIERQLFLELQKKELLALKDSGVTVTEAELNAAVMEKFFTKTRDQAILATDKMFEDAGIAVMDDGNDNDSQINRNGARYKRAVQEAMRAGRASLQDLETANRIALNDYFKGRMGSRPGVQSPEKAKEATAEFISQGVGGGIATLLRAGSDLLHSSFSKLFIVLRASPDVANTMANIASLRFFGYINGSTHFMENKLEFFAPYGLFKAMSLAAVTSFAKEDEKGYYNQRAYDAALRGISGIITASMIIALQKTICENLEDAKEVTPEDLKSGDALVMCGHKIPAWLFGMTGMNVQVYNLLFNRYDGNLEKVKTGLSVLTAGRFDSYGLQDLLSQYAVARSETRQEKILNQIKTLLVQAAFDMAISGLPIPTSFIKEVSGVTNPAMEAASVDQVENKAKWAFWQAIGLKELYISATEIGEPLLDYRGREVLNKTYQFSVGDGIRYDKYDDLLNENEVSGYHLYNGRWRMLYTATEKYSEEREDDPERYKVRPMTDQEYYVITKAAGTLTDAWLKDQYDWIQSLPEAKRKMALYAFFADVEQLTRETIEEMYAEGDGLKLKDVYELLEEKMFDRAIKRDDEDASFYEYGDYEKQVN